jgi:poly(3-hydroxyalkanoate) synthetase
MNIESFIDNLSTEQQQAAFDLLWQRLAAGPQALPSPAWHGEVLAYRSENPSSQPKMSVSEAMIEVKRMVDERRSSR